MNKSGFWTALSVPMLFIIIILIKIVLTIKVGTQAHINNSKIYTLNDFMAAQIIMDQIDTDREAIEYAKINSKILDVINSRIAQTDLLQRPNGWIAFAKKNDKNWVVTFKETGLENFLLCEFINSLKCRVVN